MKGKLIIIEGTDGSGKETQSNKLLKKLLKQNYNVKKIEYPNYKSESSALIKMYLNGDFGKDPSDISPYIASTFYTVDRYASYMLEWKEFYKNGGIIVADRYTTSNMIHQASKIKDKDERNKYLKWLWNFEFKMYGLPKPDCVIFLDMPPQYSQKLMKERVNKFTGNNKKDIHESNKEYLMNSYNNSLGLASKYKWNRINCVQGEKIKSVDMIHEEIYKVIQNMLNKEVYK